MWKTNNKKGCVFILLVYIVSMSRRHSNFHINYPKLKKYLAKNNIPYEEYNSGYHFKIMGATRFVELWPSLMKFHIVESEIATSTSYSRLNTVFSEKEVNNLLNGDTHI